MLEKEQEKAEREAAKALRQDDEEIEKLEQDDEEDDLDLMDEEEEKLMRNLKEQRLA